jgi:hypothetical protein
MLRTYYIYKIYYDSYDVSWWAGPAFLLAGIEAAMGVICASMPALKFYFSGYFNGPGSTKPFVGIGKWSIKITNRTTSYRPSDTGKDLTTSTMSNMWRDVAGDITPDGKRGMVETKGSWPKDLELGGIAVTREVEVVASSPTSPQWPLAPRQLVGPYVAPFGGGEMGARSELEQDETLSWLDDSSVHEL